MSWVVFFTRIIWKKNGSSSQEKELYKKYQQFLVENVTFYVRKVILNLLWKNAILTESVQKQRKINFILDARDFLVLSCRRTQTARFKLSNVSLKSRELFDSPQTEATFAKGQTLKDLSCVQRIFSREFLLYLTKWHMILTSCETNEQAQHN